MNRTDRLYAIVEDLRAAGARGRTSAQLAARFEVGARTIKRDVSALQQAGVPIWAEGGPGGGYRLDAAATLPPLTFTPGEALAIAVALHAQPDLPFGADARSALTKLLGAMHPSARQEAEAAVEHVYVRHGQPVEPRPPAARIVEEAIRTGTVVVVDYRARDGRRSERRPIEPLALGRDRGTWYVWAWCQRREQGRTFRLDRITAAWATTEVVERTVEEVFGVLPDEVERVRLGPGPGA
jgi:predicted DNA-binding transcriptional regulator YafY